MIAATGADGIGLFRTEFQFLVSATLPRRESQQRLYASVLDAAGSLVEYRNSRGGATLYRYDVLNRPTEVWACEQASQPLTLRQRLDYGDGGQLGQPAADRATNRAANRLGKLYRQKADETAAAELSAPTPEA